jgi:putative nucleotidyltransferase with HDIG domain
MARKEQADAREKLLDRKTEARKSPEKEEAWYRQRPQLALVLLGVLAVLLTFVIVPKGAFVPEYDVPGEIAGRDIKAQRDLLIEDAPLTEAKREEARQAILPLYDLDVQAVKNSLTRLQRALFEIVKVAQLSHKKIAETPLAAPEPAPPTDTEKPWQIISAILGFDLSVEDYQVLLNLEPELNVELLHQQLQEIFARPLVANIELFNADQQRGIVVRDLASQQEKVYQTLPRVVGLNEALASSDPLLKQTPGVKREQRRVLLSVLQRLIRPSLTYNQQETEQRRQKAYAEVTPVLFQVKKGEMIVREGERVSAAQIAKLRALREVGRDNRSLEIAAGMLVCILVFFAAAHRFVQSNVRKYNPDIRDLLFLASITLLYFVLVKLSLVIATGLSSTVEFIDNTSYYYAIPFAVGAMLVRIVLNSETALIFTVCIAWLTGILFGNSLFVAIYVLAANLIGAHGVRHCKERSHLYRAGLWVAAVNVGMLVGLHLLAARPLDIQLLYKMGLGLSGGLLSAVVVNGVIPLVETLFKYTTDIKLLELANMNSPVLRELMVQAPGTYHHSMIVGSLVESAAEEIGANPLLARVGAYYHDIGKIKKPLYFIENSGGQRNKHDKLAPSMSALILTSHVKEGVEVAREYKLGLPIINIIREHHGTALIKFFYDKAKSLSDPDVEQIDERDYRYHGPKPQTREAALIMLADAVEAASRTLTEPTPARIKGMVKKLINNIFIDGQLDECNLTFKDLHLIARSFNRILGGIFHNRIDYPEPVHIVREKKVEESQTSENPDRESSAAPEDPETPITQNSHQNLRRLGVS